MDWPADKVERRRVADLVPYAKNARTHTPAQIEQVAASIKEWGWTVPVLVDESGVLIAGHARTLAAQKLGIEEVPCMVARGWSEAQVRAYVIADNKLAENAGWNQELLAAEMSDLQGMAFDLGLMGFDAAEVDGLLGVPDEQPEKEESGIDYNENFAVVVVCQSESHQQEVYDRLTSDGYDCKVLVN